MNDANPLVNLGDLAKPATTLIEKISEAIGGVFRPHQIKRIAKAEAEAEKIKVLASLELTEIQRRGYLRLIEDEARKQQNIEDITYQSLRDLKDDARPEGIDNDWLARFFDECKLISDEEMQSLWAKLLAGEANQPGTFAKRTIDFVSNLEKPDAELFTNLCGFCLMMAEPIPLVYNLEHEVYKRRGITFASLTHLDDIGLVKFESISGFALEALPRVGRVHYYGTPLHIEFGSDEDNRFHIGNVLLTKIGKELAPICGSVRSDEILEHVIDWWLKEGLIVSCPLRKHVAAT